MPMLSAERLTFLLAMVGYVGLTSTAVLAAGGRIPRRLWRLAAVVIVAHVAMVWAVRYEWQLAEATRNGYGGFLLFHAALALIVGSLFVRERLARSFVVAAFVIVSLGALGAVFIYDVVAPYRISVIVLAAAGTAGIARAWWLRKRSAIGALP